MKVELTGGWDDAERALSQGAACLPDAIDKSIEVEGEFMREKIVAQLDEAHFAPLSPLSAIFHPASATSRSPASSPKSS